MCGITGFINKKQKEAQSLNILRKMMQVQAHRGPDDSGYAIVNREDGVISRDKANFETSYGPEKVLLGFNRLSILDLSINGHQPMINQEAGVVLMLNGEIYNAFDYRDELIKKGFQFKSTTDTEVVLNLYLAFGLDGLLERLNGMFAIAIYDQRQRQLFLIRDRFGIKPLYVLNNNEYFAFSSEVKSFGELPSFSFELDTTHFSEFLLFRNLINRTLFKNIENIHPGTYWAIDSDNNIKKVQYYDVNKEGETTSPNNDPKQHLAQNLKRAVERQMIADVKLGCQLSGGVDSSLVTYFANEFVPRGSLETISIVPSEKSFSEEAYMDIVIKQLDLVSHKYSLDAEYYFDKINDATWHFEHPLNHPNTIGIYQLSQHAKEHVTVLLSGEGADEILAGYSRFADFASPKRKIRRLLSLIRLSKKSLLSIYPHFLSTDVQMIMASSFTSIDTLSAIYPEFDFKKALEYRKRLLGKLTGNPLLRQRKYEIQTYLPDLLMRQDKMSMAHSIENRVPFLDNDMVSNSLSMDKGLLIGSSINPTPKYLLKKIAEDKFSKSFAFRPKQGFGIPLRSFFKSKTFQTLWKEEWKLGLEENELLNVGVLDKWITNIEDCDSSQLDAIWLAVGTQIWYQKYIG